ncbi:hypothetical protein CHS0354_001730 [Potamilus streckersoni]|uniref:E3 ubiquitin-protein ligase n=1 Tax=Potamilus streckersoni TaxID=2493646 RepID=A0AAE0W5Y4_9BIVA|nr:hypothetical protein CHS0354_001730 [Potamilus streckersoni]
MDEKTQECKDDESLQSQMNRKNDPDELAKNDPDELAKNDPDELAKNDPDELAKNNLDELAKNDPHELAKNDPHELAKNDPDELAKNDPHELAKNDPDELAKNDSDELAKNDPHELAKNDPHELAKNDPHELAKNDPHELAKNDPHELAKNDPRELAKKAEDIYQDNCSLMAAIDLEMKSVETHYKNMEERLNFDFQNYEKLIEQRESDLLKTLKQMTQRKVVTLEEQISNLENLEQELSVAISFTSYALSGMIAEDLLLISPTIHARLDELCSRQRDTYPRTIANVAFAKTVQDKKFKFKVDSLGQVNISEIEPSLSQIHTFPGIVGEESIILKVKLHDKEKKEIFRPNVDVQARVLNYSYTPVTPFMDLMYSSSDCSFHLNFTGQLAGIYRAMVFVSGVKVGREYRFRLYDASKFPRKDKKTDGEKETLQVCSNCNKGRESGNLKEARCGHILCEACLEAQVKPLCPICCVAYNILIGEQPKGTMEFRREAKCLPGFEDYGTIVICYTFPPGIQSACDPNPGKPYNGLKQMAFLPDSDKGRLVLQLLSKAFRRGLLFRVSSHRKKGKGNCIWFADVSHKTNRKGGLKSFGYPDSEYLDLVVNQLAALGIMMVSTETKN